MLQILTHCGTTICFEKWAFNCGSASLVENVPAHSCFTKLVIFWSYFITKLARLWSYVITNYVIFSIYISTSRPHCHHILSLCWSYYHCQYWVSEPQNINFYNAPSFLYHQIDDILVISFHQNLGPVLSLLLSYFPLMYHKVGRLIS